MAHIPTQQRQATDLEIDVAVQRPLTVVVKVEGDLDADSAAPLRAVLQRQFDAEPTPDAVVVDCEGIGFCDSAGLNLLLRANIDADRRGIALRLTHPTRSVLRLLELSGAASVLTVDHGRDVPSEGGQPSARGS